MSQYPVTPSYQPAPRQVGSGLAIASLVLGIISLFFCIWYVAIPCGILAIIFGVIAMGKAKTGEAGGAGMARAGLIMGCIGLAIDVIVVVLIFTVGVSFFKSVQQQIKQQQQQQQQQPTNPSPTSPSPASPTPSSLAPFGPRWKF